MPEKGMSGLKQKSKHNHLIEHIQISVCTKLHTEQMIWACCQIWVFPGPKQEKWTLPSNSAYLN